MNQIEIKIEQIINECKKRIDEKEFAILSEVQIHLNLIEISSEDYQTLLLNIEKSGEYIVERTVDNDDYIIKKNTNYEKRNLEIQQLRSDNIRLVNENIDFPKIVKQRNVLFIIAIVELLAILLSLILKSISKS